MIDDGTTVSYHKTINATCKEKLLKDVFSGWELELPKPIEQIQVCMPTAIVGKDYLGPKGLLNISSPTGTTRSSSSTAVHCLLKALASMDSCITSFHFRFQPSRLLRIFVRS